MKPIVKPLTKPEARRLSELTTRQMVLSPSALTLAEREERNLLLYRMEKTDERRRGRRKAAR